MKFKELLPYVLFPIISVWIVQHFFYKPGGEAQVFSGEQFKAPQSMQVEVHRPLNTEVDFLDSKIKKPITTVVQTSLAEYVFSSAGAIVSQVEFKRQDTRSAGRLSTIFPPATTEREKGSFLLAFDQETPYNFELKENTQTEDRHILIYTSTTSTCAITKKFEIFKELYRIDLSVNVQPSGSSEIRPRIFWVSPCVPELGQQDVITGLVNKAKGVGVLPKAEETLASYWSKPTLFGTQDRYFIHAMVNDEHAFAQRGYFKTVDLDSMYSIIEGPKVSAATSWKLSFYVGPKEDDALSAVDKRLIDTLNYGWFGFISKPLANFLWYIIELINNIVRNYGWSIVILTILFKVLMLPFTYKVESGMQQSRESFSKKVRYIKQKYKDDPHAAARAQAELLKKEAIPGLGGCSVQFIQLPMIWAISILVSNSFELFRAPFLWVPDLTAPDPYYVLPILNGLSILVMFTLHQGSVNSGNTSGAYLGKVLLAALITALFINFSAGLVLYFFVSTLFSVLQTLIAKRLKNA